MRLANLVPRLSRELIAQLKEIGIRTESDLLFSATPFEIFSRLPAGTASLDELESVVDSVTELCAAPGASALFQLQVEAQARAPCIQLCSGNGDVDRLLQGLGGGGGGGGGCDNLIQISGDKYTGKSILALNLVLNYLASHAGSTAAWIDTTGDFSVEIARDILATKRMPPEVLEHLRVSLLFDLQTLQVVLDQLFQPGLPSPQLLVIDSITPLLAPLLSAVSAHGHAQMTDLMRHLRLLSQTAGLTVLLLNSAAKKGPDSQERKPALGPSFGLLTDATLWLQMTDHDVHSLQLISSRAKACGDAATFRIDSNVICANDGYVPSLKPIPDIMKGIDRVLCAQRNNSMNYIQGPQVIINLP